MNDEKTRAKRARIFDRHARAARDGVHLPSLVELIRGMDFCNGRLNDDIMEFSTRVLMRLKRMNVQETALGTALRILSVSYEVSDLLAAAKAFEDHPESRRFTERYLKNGMRRCDYYAACNNDRDAMLRVAGYAMDEAQYYTVSQEVALELSYAALGWLSLFGRPLFSPRNGHSTAQTAGSEAFSRMREEQDRQNATLGVDSRRLTAKDRKTEKKDAALDETANTDTPSWTENNATPLAVVIDSIGNVDLHEGRDVKREFSGVIGTALPLCPVKDLHAAQRALDQEFPQARAITESVISRLSECSYVRLRPLLLIGPAGCGKTSYAQGLMDALGVPCEIFPCGGTTDSAFQGTPRRWASGEPSVPLSLIRRYMVASPGIVLDEIEKASASRYNGSLFDCLLGLLEPRTSSKWRDPYIQAHVNLSHVIWIGTANSSIGIPPTLLDRMTALQFPVPDRTHLPLLANSILRRTLVSRGYDERWAFPLDGEELAALSEAWPGGSMRQLQRLVEVVMDARSAFYLKH